MGRLNYVSLGKILVALQQDSHCARKAIFLAWWKLGQQHFPQTRTSEHACRLIICWTKQCDLSSGYLPHIILHFYANIFYFISPARILFTKFINWNLEPEYLGLPKESIGMRFPFSLKTWSQVKTLVKSLIDIKPPLRLNNSSLRADEIKLWLPYLFD